MKIFGILILLVYILIPVMFYQNMSEFDNHHMSSMSNCQYMEDGQSICPMNFLFYLGIWGLTSTINVQDLKIFVSLLFFVISCLFISKILKIFKPNIFFNNQRYRLIPDLYIELYSKGILNGKAY